MKPFLPPVIAHRGASAYAPENTLAAFRKAHDLGIQWIEFDVMLSADHVPIIFHDNLLDRTTNGRGEVGDFSFKALHELDAGAWFNPKFSGEHIPSLQDTVAFLRQTGMAANIEIKP